jgi:4-hydroxy-3-polyprenylbenzoate decarboxylase
MPVEGVFHNVVLASIEKRFPGQGLKVMNSLWGAGQMMFNKILLVTDGEINLDNYPEVARIVTKNVNPLTDILFIRGPVDVLDHSSRNFAFGSKMGIDATEKLPEEKDPGARAAGESFLDFNNIRKSFPEISAMNDSLLSEGISIVIFAVKKNRRNHIREISKAIISGQWIRNISFILFMDSEVNIQNLKDVTWIGANNIDPMRDCHHVQLEDLSFYPGLFIDGTRKTNEFDQFQRDWPNIILMDEKTIKKIDENWDSYQLGKYLPSPSVLYKSLVLNVGAIANENT